MNRKIFGFSLALALLMIAANGLWAQVADRLPIGFLTSPQSQATQGRFRSNADDFIRSDYYTNLDFKTFYALTSFANSGRASLGFATKLGGLYLATYYGGTFWYNKSLFVYSKEDHLIDPVFDRWNNFPTYRNGPQTGADFEGAPQNRFAILIGVANMGFRVSYASTHEDFDESDIAAVVAGDTIFLKNYVIAFGTIAPQLEWAMAKDLTEKNGLRPKVGLTLSFIRDYQRYQSFNPADGKTENEWTSYSNNYIEPHLVLNPNGFHIYNKDGFRLTVDLDYELKFRMYSNDYSYLSTDGKIMTDTIKGLYSEGGTLTENSYMSNLFTPSLAGQWSNEKIGLKFKFSLPVGISSEGKSGMYLDSDNKLAKGSDSKASTLSFEPNLALAAQWKALPDKLHLNVGGRLYLSNISRTSTEGSSYDVLGDKTPHSDTTTVTNEYKATSNELTLGASFMPIENLTFEATCGIGANNALNVFSTTAREGLFVFSSILAALKF